MTVWLLTAYQDVDAIYSYETGYVFIARRSANDQGCKNQDIYYLCRLQEDSVVFTLVIVLSDSRFNSQLF